MQMHEVRQALSMLPQHIRTYLEQSLPPALVKAKIREVKRGGKVTLGELVGTS